MSSWFLYGAALKRGQQGMVPCRRRVQMDKQSLENRINRLKEARDACSNQLDIGAKTELDGAIAALETLCERHHSEAEAAVLQLRALQAIAALVSITTNIRDWF